MDFLAKCGCFIIVILNLVFLLLATALLAAGCIVKFGSSLIDKYVLNILDAVSSLAKTADVDINTDDFDLNRLVGDAAIAFIVLGAILLVIAIVGCCGACCKVTLMLKIYAGILILLFLAQIALVIALFSARSSIDGHLKKSLNATIKNNYEGIRSRGVITMAWNYLMISLKCCGVDNYRDFNGAAKWNNSYMSKTLKTPIACCRTNGSVPISSTGKFDCAINPTNITSNYKEGCYQKLWDKINEKQAIMIASGVVAAIFQILLIFFTIRMIKSINEQNKVYPA